MEPRRRPTPDTSADEKPPSFQHPSYLPTFVLVLNKSTVLLLLLASNSCLHGQIKHHTVCWTVGKTFFAKGVACHQKLGEIHNLFSLGESGFGAGQRWPKESCIMEMCCTIQSEDLQSANFNYQQIWMTKQ